MTSINRRVKALLNDCPLMIECTCLAIAQDKGELVAVLELDNGSIRYANPQNMEFLPEKDAPGPLAYTAYCKTVNYVAVDGASIPEWNDLPEKLKLAWITAATVAVLWDRRRRQIGGCWQRLAVFQRVYLHGSDLAARPLLSSV